MVGKDQAYKQIAVLVDSGQVETFGEVQGFITYGNGRVLVLIVEGNRPKAGSLEKINDEQRAKLFRTFLVDGRQIAPCKANLVLRNL